MELKKLETAIEKEKKEILFDLFKDANDPSHITLVEAYKQVEDRWFLSGSPILITTSMIDEARKDGFMLAEKLGKALIIGECKSISFNREDLPKSFASDVAFALLFRGKIISLRNKLIGAYQAKEETQPDKQKIKKAVEKKILSKGFNVNNIEILVQ